MADSARKCRARAEDSDPFWNRYEWPPDQSCFASGEENDDDDTGFTGCCSCVKNELRHPGASEGDDTGEARQIPSYIDPQFDPQCADGWDTEDPAYLDKVSCECLIKVTAVEPKTSRFELRMKCKWSFRTLHSHSDDGFTETKLRVPGLRLPGLIVEVNESRVWKDLQETSESCKTIFWRGVSIFTIMGFERFEMHDFPFDRQLMSLDVFEFVWQEDKDSTEFDFSMPIVSFRIETVSLLPEWRAATAIVQAHNVREQHPRDGPGGTGERPPDFANVFSVKLRLERKSRFYLVQIFGLSILITFASTLPLLLPHTEGGVGDRLELYAAGVLTLTSFKFSIDSHLPSVPYSTMLDRIILIEIISVISCALESVVAYRYAMDYTFLDEDHPSDHTTVDRMEIAIFAFWTLWWLIIGLRLCAEGMNCRCLAKCFGMKFMSWSIIIHSQEDQADFDELEEWEPREDLESETRGAKQLESLSLQICQHLARQGPTDEDSLDGDRLDQLKKKRDELESRLFSAIPSAAKTHSPPPKTARAAPKASGRRLASSKTPSKVPRRPIHKV